MKKTISHAAVMLGFAFPHYPMLIWYVRRMSDGSDEPHGLVPKAPAG